MYDKEGSPHNVMDVQVKTLESLVGWTKSRPQINKPEPKTEPKTKPVTVQPVKAKVEPKFKVEPKKEFKKEI